MAAAAGHGADAVFFGYTAFRDGQPSPPEPVASAAILADRTMLLDRPAFAWTKLVRTELMRSKGIEFPEGICFEDTPVHWRVAIESERPVFLDEALVWYRQRKGSITHRTDWSRADRILAWDLIGTYLRSAGRWSEWKDIFLARQLAGFAHTHAYYAWANPTLTHGVREETRARMTSEHWNFVLRGKGLSRWERDYLIACGNPTGTGTGPRPLMPILRHRLRHPLRCLWHRLRLVFGA